MFSARIADRMGFKALYMTGYGVSASHLGLPDAGLVTYRDMVDRARTIAEGITTPLIADADTGFGGLIMNGGAMLNAGTLQGNGSDEVVIWSGGIVESGLPMDVTTYRGPIAAYV